MFIYYNPNPIGNETGDCVIRAISKVLDRTWDEVYIDLFTTAYSLKDMMDRNTVWGRYLDELGMERRAIPDSCPYCYTIKDFCEDHPKGSYVLGTGTHVVAVIDGDYYDTWDSGNKIPMYYWSKGE